MNQILTEHRVTCLTSPLCTSPDEVLEILVGPDLREAKPRADRNVRPSRVEAATWVQHKHHRSAKATPSMLKETIFAS
jgi:hypothetical protein